MHETNLLNLEVRQATTSKMTIQIDPRMKTFLARGWFVFCLLVSPKRGIKMAIIGVLGSISINISGPSSILEFMEMK